MPHAPKPAYRAAAAAQRLLGGRPFAGRLNVSGAPEGVPSYALRFGPAAGHVGEVLVAWTVGWPELSKTAPPKAQCAVPPPNQTDCGPRGQSPKTCAARGCCWEARVPQCYAPRQDQLVVLEIELGVGSLEAERCCRLVGLFGEAHAPSRACAQGGRLRVEAGSAPLYMLPS